MNIAINAISMHPGGGLTVLLGLLEAWREFADELTITVLANDPKTLAAVQAIDWIQTAAPIDVGHSVSRQYMWQNYRLGQELARRQADILLTNNHFVYNVYCRQIVHHHNAWRFVTGEDLPKKKFAVGDFVRDWTARKALHSAAANVFVSHYLRARAESFVPSSSPRNATIPNALPDAVVNAAQQIPFQPQVNPQLLVIQSANVHKDNPTAIRTLAELVRRAPLVDWKLKIAGSEGRGSQEPLRVLAREKGVEGRITWCGFCSHAQLDALFKESLCLLSTSILEAGPLPVIEAMARRCVPVAARIPAVEEFVANGGVLVDPYNAEQFADAVIQLHRDVDLRRRLTDNGVAQVQNFRWADRGRRFMEVFRRVMAER